MTQPAANASTWHLDSLTGKRVGRFLVRERLGGGGMGEVYRAEDTVLKRSVALKRVAPHLRSDLLYRQRFLREAERASRFSDPHIAAIYDVLEDNGEAFLVMEYVEGQTLRRRLSQPLQLGHIFHIVLQCADGLAVSHSHGVVHCDIKPENIMLTTDGQVKILDFGVAKRLPSSDQSITLEKSQTLSGTPGYMAPEVLLENVPDGRADIFSLGVVLYEALTSYQPFRASSFVATSERVLREIPSPVTMLNPKLPPELNGLIAKMLAKNPSERFQSAQELKTEISRLQEEIGGLRMTAHPPRSTTGQIPLPQQPSKVRHLGLSLLAATLLLLSMAIVWQRAYRPSHAAKIFPARSSLLISDFETADHALPEAGLREGLTIALQQSRYVNVYPRSRVYEVLERMKRTNVGGIDESLGREICQRENVHTLLVGSIVRIGDIIQISVRAVDPAQGNVLFAEKIRLANNTEFFDKVDWLARRVREDLGESIPAIENSSRPLAKVTTSSLTALQLYSQATDAFGLGKLEEVPPLLQSALDLDPEFAMAHHLLSQIYEIMGNRAKEQKEVKRAYALRQSVTERERRLIEASYYNLTGDDSRAVDALLALVALYPDDPDAHAFMASQYYDMGELAAAILQLRQVIKIDPGSARTYGKLVTWLARNNAPEEAMQVYKEAAARGLDSPSAKWGMGMALWNQGKLVEAQGEFRVLQAAGPPYDSIGRIYLARTLLYQGYLSEAEEQLAAGIWNDKAAQNQSPELLQRYLLALIAIQRGNRPLARQQLALIVHSGEPEAFQATDLQRAGTLYTQMGELGLARDALRRLEELQSRNGNAFNKAHFHLLAGEIALSEGHYGPAMQNLLASQAEYPFAVTHGELARAYENAQDWQRAAAEWQELLRGRGEIFQDGDPTQWVLAHLALARVYAHLGDATAARAEYNTFLNIWAPRTNLSTIRDARREVQELGPVQGTLH